MFVFKIEVLFFVIPALIYVFAIWLNARSVVKLEKNIWHFIIRLVSMGIFFGLCYLYRDLVLSGFLVFASVYFIAFLGFLLARKR